MRNDEGVCNECFVGPDRHHHFSCSQYEDEFFTGKPGALIPSPFRAPEHKCVEACRPDAHIATPTRPVDPGCAFCVLDGHCEIHDPKKHDPVNHPKHYTSHPSGVECIQITEHMGFNIGNAIKYLWRADDKGAPIEDLEKAKWYIEREIKKRRACDQTDLVKETRADKKED